MLVIKSYKYKKPFKCIRMTILVPIGLEKKIRSSPDDLIGEFSGKVALRWRSSSPSSSTRASAAWTIKQLFSGKIHIVTGCFIQ